MSFYKRPPKNIEDLANVSGTPETGEALVWNGTAWVPAAAGVSEEYVDGAIAALVDSSPAALDTLSELASALGNDEDFAVTVIDAIVAAEGSANAYTDTALSTHTSDTTSVHGIADTSLLETTAGAQTKADGAVTSANSYTDTAINGTVRVVAHGATASTARPTGAAAVYWIGSVAPTNATNSDLWYDTTGDV